MTDLTLGALYDPEGGTTRFRVWAPKAERVEVVLYRDDGGEGGDGETVDRTVPLEAEHGEAPEHGGYHAATVEDAPPGCLYRYRLHHASTSHASSQPRTAGSSPYQAGSAKDRPDPASRHQPRGVHGPSAVVDPTPPERVGGWNGLPLADHVLYELHVGTFTGEGTFDAVVPHLDDLAELGVTAVELLPVAQFPGSRNWGYDGVQPFAVQHSYGGPEGLKRLVRAAHERGLAVIMDAVYNHLGPEGNYLYDYGPYFTRKYSTPWGDALNYDGPHSDPVRRFFIENAVYWIIEHGIDGLRLDAVHAIFDNSEHPFLAQLAAAVQKAGEERGRRVHLFAESAVNTLRFLRRREHGGCGMDGQWSDDFHHALHTVLTGEDEGYYEDFGRLGQLAKAYRDGWVYTGQYSSYRRRRHGVRPRGVEPQQLVVFIQNHDQTGNRMRGDRLAALVDPASLRLAAAAVLLSPFTPLLFMGEEYGEERPFQYFVSHGDPDLVEAVRQGRAEEFAAFGWSGEVPDPQAEETFRASTLDRSIAGRPEKAGLQALYRELLRLRREVRALSPGPAGEAGDGGLEVESHPAEGALTLLRTAADGDGQALVALAFSRKPQTVEVEVPPGEWRILVDSEAPRWRNGEGGTVGEGREERLRSSGTLRLSLAPRSCLVLTRG